MIRGRSIRHRVGRFSQRRGALIIAVLALATAIWSASEDRRHKRLSVRPQVTVGYAFNAEQVGWAMRNSGLGPAVIGRFEVYVDDERRTNWDAFMAALNIKPATIGFGQPHAGETISSGVTLALFSVNPKEEPVVAALLQNSWQRVRFEVCYCSLYEECWRVATRRDPPRLVSRRSVSSCELPRIGEATWFGNQLTD
jgi:hypothetical protein